MARKGKVNKEWRIARDAARSGNMPDNLVKSSGKMSPEELQAHIHRARQSDRKAPNSAKNRQKSWRPRMSDSYDSGVLFL